MTDFQKFIKIAAIVLAVFLIISIVSGIIKLVAGLSWLINSDGNVAAESQVYTLAQDIDSLYIDIGAGELRIETGDRFRLESNHSKLSVKDSGGRLQITEETNLNGNYNDVYLTLTVPVGYLFQSADITSGSGTVSIDFLWAKELVLEFGAGEVRIDYLEAVQKAHITAGAGKLTILDGCLHDLDMEMGLGKTNLTVELQGSCDLEQGVGEVNLTLLGNADTYTVSVEKGIGDISLDGVSVKNNTTLGNGASKIKIEGGIGAINIFFKA